MYSILADGVSKKVSKGVAKTFVRKHLTHQDYARVLDTGTSNQAKVCRLSNSAAATTCNNTTYV